MGTKGIPDMLFGLVMMGGVIDCNCNVNATEVVRQRNTVRNVNDKQKAKRFLRLIDSQK